MPLIVDKEAVRMEILMAFQRCIDRKPLTNVSLRDIAAEANMSHAKLLNYFDSKEDLLVSYVRYTRDYMSQKCLAWFNEHDRADYGSNAEYMNAFMSYVARGKTGEQRRTRPRRPMFWPITMSASASLFARSLPSGGA